MGLDCWAPANDLRPNSTNATRLELNPSFTVARLRSSAHSDNTIYLAGRERVYEGMRKAGLPEGDKKTS